MRPVLFAVLFLVSAMVGWLAGWLGVLSWLVGRPDVGWLRLSAVSTLVSVVSLWATWWTHARQENL